MSSKKKTYRWGILGTGRMAADFATELSLVDNAALVAAASSRKGRAHPFAREFGIPLAFDDYDALLSCNEVDVVYIAGTHDTHFPFAMRCIECNLPVLVEKPICTRNEDLALLREAAAAQQVFCMEAMWTAFFPAVRDLKQTLFELGPIQHLEATFCIDIPFDPQSRLYNPALGGGAMLEIGIYPLALAYYLYGGFPPSFDSRLTLSPTGTDTAGEINLLYEDGKTAHLVYSLSGFRPHKAEIVCESGTVVLEDFFHPSRITVYRKGKEPKAQMFTYPHKGYNYEIAAVHASLNAGLIESELWPLGVSAEILSAMEKILTKQ